MKKSLQYISTAKMSRSEWLAMRHNQDTIGGSDIGVIMGLNPYCPAIKLFHQKVGLWPIISEDNMGTYRGRILEDVIAKHYWPYWEINNPDQDTMLKNATSGNVIRKCRNVNFVVKNPKYTWLAVNLDRVFKHGKRDGYLEIKTALGFAANQWESGFPPYNILQLLGCMEVCEFSYGELALLKDGTFFDVMPLERNVSIVEGILEKTKAFHELIVRGREIMSSEIPLEEKETMINIISPEPDGTDACREYMTERHKIAQNLEAILGTEIERELAIQYLKANKSIKDFTEVKNLSGNKLKEFMLQNKVKVIDFNGPKITWGEKFSVSSKLLTA
jgi:predicted phage-related endonuclease